MQIPPLRLGINIDHVATLRNARSRDSRAHPDLLAAVAVVTAAGADGITFHLREDRRHILDDDVLRLHETVKLPLNFEMAATAEMTAIAQRIKPHAVCLVPERRMEVTTEGGLDVVREGQGLLNDCVRQLSDSGIQVALFIDPDPAQVAAAAATGCAAIELHTGRYCAVMGTKQSAELTRLRLAARQASDLGLEVHAGHGLDYANVGSVAAIPEIVELNIGHHIVGAALFIGLTAAVQKMRAAMDIARAGYGQ
ncbi:MAG: pyridoxine 5'-phosphate synthase [Alphaproteobacteria bacterium]|nr:pyridoxine 5'-phosphate synthase [Alphaproteobacteria bacterium]